MPLVAETEKVRESPVQTVAPPPVMLIGPGVAGAVPPIETARLREGLLPQPFDAITEILPAEVPTVTVMVFVDELPVQPFGNVHA